MRLVFLSMRYEQRESAEQHWEQIPVECIHAQDPNTEKSFLK